MSAWRKPIENKTCPQCSDIANFKDHEVYYRGAKQWHDELVAEANELAKKSKNVEFMKGSCDSTMWQDLWFGSFRRIYEMLLNKRINDMISKYEDECYKKRYGDREKYICSYHAELR